MVIFNALQATLSGGIGRYSYELSKAIYQLKQNPFKIVIRKEDEKLYDFAKKEDLIIVSNIKNSKDRNYYEQFILPKQIEKSYKDAVIHYPDTMAPLFGKSKVVITVHDLAFKSVKGAFTWKTTLWKNFITDLSIKKAEKMIAITHFAKEEVQKHYKNINKDKISVVYNGFNDFSKEEIINENVNKKILNLKSKDYILTVSTISPRKNIDGLIKAFNAIKEEVDCNLVIAGKKGWLYESVFQLVEDLNIQDRVIFTGGVNDDELKYLYKNAACFVYPSFYEGFGLPPLEAMSFGTPCVVSNVTSIPEVVGNAGLCINPYSVSDLSDKIKTVINDEGVRQNLIQLGYERINLFSWEKCAEGTIEVYKELIRQ